jgi:hypothetical protein
MVIHYSCGDLYNSIVTFRITSIACMRMHNNQTHNFNLSHYMDMPSTSTDDEAERKMLQDFFDFTKTNKAKSWLHWHMRDSNYGFTALENRLLLLNGIPYHFSTDKTIDLAELLSDAYGATHSHNLKMYNLALINNIVPNGFLNGKQEVQAFADRNFQAINISCSSKVRLFGKFSDLAHRKKLQTRKMKLARLVIGADSSPFMKGVYVLGGLAALGAVLFSLYSWVAHFFRS